MRQSSFFSSAQAQRLPWRSKHRPLDRPQGCRNVESLPSDAPLQDPVVGLVGEEDVAVGVGGRAFGELELAGQLFDFGPGAMMPPSSAAAASEADRNEQTHRPATSARPIRQKMVVIAVFS